LTQDVQIGLVSFTNK